MRSRRSDERGVALLEAAITLPIFMLLIFGTMEFGLAFRGYMTMSNATRDAARFGTTLGNDIDADFQMVSEIRANMDLAGTDEITKIIIFKATGPESTTDSGSLAACQTASVVGLCNTYTGAAIESDPDEYGCGYASPDRFWCPGDRLINLSDPPDYIGVYIEIRHNAATGIMGLSRDFHDEVVMRMEPVRA